MAASLWLAVWTVQSEYTSRPTLVSVYECVCGFRIKNATDNLWYIHLHTLMHSYCISQDKRYTCNSDRVFYSSWKKSQQKMSRIKNGIHSRQTHTYKTSACGKDAFREPPWMIKLTPPWWPDGAIDGQCRLMSPYSPRPLPWRRYVTKGSERNTMSLLSLLKKYS